MDLLALVLLVVGLGVGTALGWLVAGRRSAAADGAAGALRAERDAAQAQLAALTQDRAVLEARATAAEVQSAQLATTLAHEKVTQEQRLADLQQAQVELTRQFSEISHQALERTTKQLAELTDERLKQSEKLSQSELDQRKQAVENLVKPLSDSLTKVQEQVAKVEVERTRAYSGLVKEVEQMRTTSESLRVETTQLVTALRRPEARGQWGETALRRTVEAAGMVEHVHFNEQVTVSSADGISRPDLVVHLAGGKHVVVDSKVPFIGVLEANEARDESVRAERLKAHARHLRDHIDGLAAKTYWAQFESTPEFVVLFVPAETFLNAALEQDPSLLERGFEKNVVIATPATLVALLRTVAYTWRQEALAKNAQEVFTLGKELHGRLSTMGGEFAKLGNALGRSVEAYNKTVGSLESRVLVTARKLAELHLAETELDAPAQLVTAPRALHKAELIASAEESLVVLPNSDTQDVEAGASGQ
jgi:DNA recombination protein RmuC